MKWFLTGVAALCVVGFAQAAGAAVVLSDDFNTDAPLKANWAGDSIFTSVAVVNAVGRVASTDLVGPGFYGFLCSGGGKCVDLDGSTGYGNSPVAGELASKMSFGPGLYKLKFDLRGNDRGAPAQTTVITLGGATVGSLTLASSAPDTTYTYVVKTASLGKLVFTEEGPSDQQGNVIDNITLSTVPEPASWTLMIAGLGGLGAAKRRARLQGQRIA